MLTLLHGLNSLGELGLSLLKLSLGLISLLLQETESAFPKSLILVVVVDSILVLAFKVLVLTSLTVKLGTDLVLVTFKSFLELSDLLIGTGQFILLILDQSVLLSLQVLVLDHEDLLLALVVGDLLLKSVLQLLASLSLGFILRVSMLLLGLKTLSLFLNLTLHFFAIDLDSVLVSLDSALKLSLKIVGFLLGEDDLLVLQSSFTLKLNLLLGQLVFLVLELALHLVELLLKLSLFDAAFFLESVEELILLLELNGECLLLVLKSGASTLFTSNFLSKFLVALSQLASLLVELLMHSVLLLLGLDLRLLKLFSHLMVHLAEVINLLVSKTNLSVEFSLHVLGLLLHVGKFLLKQVDILVILLLKLTDLVLTFLSENLAVLSGSGLLIIEALLKTLLLTLVEGLELVELIFTGVINLLDSLLVLAFLLLQLVFEISNLSVVSLSDFINDETLLALKLLHAVAQRVSLLLSLMQQVIQVGELVLEIVLSKLKLESDFLTSLGELLDFIVLLLELSLVLLLQAAHLLLELGLLLSHLLVDLRLVDHRLSSVRLDGINHAQVIRFLLFSLLALVLKTQSGELLLLFSHGLELGLLALDVFIDLMKLLVFSFKFGDALRLFDGVGLILLSKLSDFQIVLRLKFIIFFLKLLESVLEFLLVNLKSILLLFDSLLEILSFALNVIKLALPLVALLLGVIQLLSQITNLLLVLGLGLATGGKSLFLLLLQLS